jgi:hypothetical protein
MKLILNIEYLDRLMMNKLLYYIYYILLYYIIFLNQQHLSSWRLFRLQSSHPQSPGESFYLFLVREMFTKCQFHQHFTLPFFIRNQIEQLFYSYIPLCKFFGAKLSAKKFWLVNFSLLIIYQARFYALLFKNSHLILENNISIDLI